MDILIDLNGYTQGARMGILTQRPAPITGRLSRLCRAVSAPIISITSSPIAIGHSGTGFRESSAKKPVWLPDSFMVNDAARAIAERMPTRASCGLPDGAIVFCCFNQPYKIGPDNFR